MNDSVSSSKDSNITKMVNFVLRWQDWLGWLPLTVVIFWIAYVILGSLDKTAKLDQLALVISLTIKIMYALAALGLTHLARRRWRYKLTKTEQQDFWKLLMSGERGAIVVFLSDAVITVFLIGVLLFHFRLPS